MLYSTPTSYRPLRTAPALTWSVHLCVQLPASFRLTSFVSTVYLLLPLHGYSSTPFESIRYALLSPRWSVEPPPGAKSGTQPCKNPFCSTCATGPIEQVERSEEHTSELQSHHDLVCRLLL